MSEKIGAHPALEKLKSLFEWENTEGFRNLHTATIALNDNEEIKGELFSKDVNDPTMRELVQIRVMRDKQRLVGFQVGQKGLESIGFGELELSFRGSPRIKINEGIGISNIGETTALHVDGEEWKKFTELAGIVVDWVEDIKFKKEIGEIPLSLVRQTR